MMHYKNAKHLSDRLVELLTPHCDLIHIAGSIRRQKKVVKDIEIVCLPKREFFPTDLFGNGFWGATEGFTKVIKDIQKKVIKGNTQGRYMQLILKGGAVLDLFMPVLYDYYRQLAIRTGSAEYSSLVIATAWKRKGWCGTHDGLRRILDCTQSKSGTWICFNKNPELPPAWKSEEEFFSWLGLEYLIPQKREVKKAINQFS